MKPRTKLSASFKAKYWARVAECLQLLTGRRESAATKKFAQLRRQSDDLFYHLDPIQVAKRMLGLHSIPESALARYREMISEDSTFGS